jgi:hypothetical protein
LEYLNIFCLAGYARGGCGDDLDSISSFSGSVRFWDVGYYLIFLFRFYEADWPIADL